MSLGTMIYLFGIAFSLINRYYSYRRMESNLYKMLPFAIPSNYRLPFIKVLSIRDYIYSLIPIWHYISGLYFLITLYIPDNMFDDLINECEKKYKEQE